MQVTIRADDGDEVQVSLDALAVEQAMVRLSLDCPAYASSTDPESISLTPARARDLGRALLLAANVLEDAVGLYASSNGVEQKAAH